MSKPKLPKEIKTAIVLRDAGHTLSSISVKTGISSSTLYRYFKKHTVARGALATETIDEARQHLLTDAGFINQLKHKIASTIIDDLSLVKQLRESLALTLEDLTCDTETPAILKARSLAALSTSLKITQDVARRALNVDSEFQSQKELTTLTVVRMSDDRVREVQERLRRDDEAMIDN